MSYHHIYCANTRSTHSQCNYGNLLFARLPSLNNVNLDGIRGLISVSCVATGQPDLGAGRREHVATVGTQTNHSGNLWCWTLTPTRYRWACDHSWDSDRPFWKPGIVNLDSYQIQAGGAAISWEFWQQGSEKSDDGPLWTFGEWPRKDA